MVKSGRDLRYTPYIRPASILLVLTGISDKRKEGCCDTFCIKSIKGPL